MGWKHWHNAATTQWQFPQKYHKEAKTMTISWLLWQEQEIGQWCTRQQLHYIKILNVTTGSGTAVAAMWANVPWDITVTSTANQKHYKVQSPVVMALLGVSSSGGGMRTGPYQTGNEKGVFWKATIKQQNWQQLSRLLCSGALGSNLDTVLQVVTAMNGKIYLKKTIIGE